MRIAAISDTHGKAHPNAAALIAKAKPHLILHAGDIGDLEVLEPFAAIAQTLVVRGNIDGARAAPDVRIIDLQGPGEYFVRILLMHIALYGARLLREAKDLVAEHKAHLLVCGHSHVPFLGQERSVVIFNPGSIGPRRFHLPICFGLMELGPGHTSIKHIDCETGEPWMPPD